MDLILVLIEEWFVYLSGIVVKCESKNIHQEDMHLQVIELRGKIH